MSRQLDQRAGVTVTDGAVPAARQDVAVSPEAAVAAAAVEESCEYYLWQDNTIYGPVELPMLARWIGEHPSLRVARWHCAWPAQEDEKI